MSDTTTHDAVLVWDLPVRVFHWLLAGSFAGAWLTAESERWRDVHAVLGYTALVLVALRVLWGLFGTRYARFSAMPLSPSRALAYLRSLAGWRPSQHVGHNPAGSLAIYALLAFVLLTALTGIAAINEWGGERMVDLHEGMATTLLVIVVVHVAGVVVGSLAHRENLVRAMLTGRKRGAEGSGIGHRRPLAAALLVAIVLGIWTGLVPTPGLQLSHALIDVTAPAHASVHPRGNDDD